MSNSGGVPVVGTNPVPVVPGGATAANIVTGYLGFTSTTGATTAITVAQARTWVGSIVVACTVATLAGVTASTAAIATIATAGTGVVPAAGTLLVVKAECGGGAAGGTTGEQDSTSVVVPCIIVAPAGNAVTITVAAAISATAAQGSVDVSCIGQLL